LWHIREIFAQSSPEPAASQKPVNLKPRPGKLADPTASLISNENPEAFEIFRGQIFVGEFV
jgi:hypothetical protein